MTREPGDELRMTQAELDASVAGFCEPEDVPWYEPYEPSEVARDAFEAQAGLLDSPDVISGAWPPGGLPHGEHPYDYDYDKEANDA